MSIAILNPPALNLLNQILAIKSGLKACLPVMFKRDDSIVLSIKRYLVIP